MSSSADDRADPVSVRFADTDGWRRPRPRVILAVALLHGALGWLVIAGLGGVSAVAEKAGLTLPVSTIRIEPPQPPPSPEPRVAEKPAGAAAPAGRKAQAAPVSAPRPKIAIRPRIVAAPVAGNGAASTSGAANAGAGTGGGGQGSGTGSGAGGNGSGGGAARPPVKIAGDITTARDYPPDPEGARLGRSVVVALTVGTDGRVSECRVRQASGDPSADAITCRLAQQRFRFRPAVNAAGEPVEALYGWKQSWFKP